MHPTPLVVDISRSLEPASALDVGCANGRNAKYLNDHGWRVTAIDPTLAELPQSIRFVQSSLLGFKDTAQHELVLCLMVLHFLPNQNEIEENIMKLRSLTKPSGLLAISVLTNKNPQGVRPHLFSEGELLSYFEDWEVVINAHELAQPIDVAGKPIRYYVQRLVVRKPS